jgi:acetyl-CoA acetyltransferase
MASTDNDIAIIAVSQTPSYSAFDGAEPVMIMHCVNDLLERTGLERDDIEFTIAGSCDYLSGMPFAFVQNIDGVGAWPPVYESHVEMDGAWALFEAWLRLQEGDIDIAVVTGSGRSSTGDPELIYPMEMDPYFLAPIGADPLTFAALQARAVIDAGIADERAMAEVSVRARGGDVDTLLAGEYVREPLRRHDIPPITDGAAAMVLARGDRAREIVERPAFITGFDHRTECHNPSFRPLADSPSTRIAAAAAGLGDGPVEVAELQTAFTHEELLLRSVLGLGDDVAVNPSGGPLRANPIMATGLIRIGHAADHVFGGGGRALAHATSGPCLQQNLVCIVEGSNR